MSLEEFRTFVYDSYAQGHVGYSGQDSRERAGRLAQYRHVLSQHLPENRSARILDFGCGDGTLLRIAAQLGYGDLVGIDVSEGMIDIARKAGTAATLHVGDALAFVKEAPAGSFDTIIAYDVLEHLTRPELLNTLRAMSAALAPGGRLIFHLPNGGSPFYGRVRWGDITHELAFTRSSLVQLLVPLGIPHVHAQEDVPIAHGLKSTIRRAAWFVLRLFLVAWLAVENGQLRGHVLSQNMVVVARR